MPRTGHRAPSGELASTWWRMAPPGLRQRHVGPLSNTPQLGGRRAGLPAPGGGASCPKREQDSLGTRSHGRPQVCPLPCLPSTGQGLKGFFSIRLFVIPPIIHCLFGATSPLFPNCSLPQASGQQTHHVCCPPERLGFTVWERQ